MSVNVVQAGSWKWIYGWNSDRWGERRECWWKRIHSFEVLEERIDGGIWNRFRKQNRKRKSRRNVSGNVWKLLTEKSFHSVRWCCCLPLQLFQLSNAHYFGRCGRVFSGKGFERKQFLSQQQRTIFYRRLHTSHLLPSRCGYTERSVDGIEKNRFIAFGLMLEEIAIHSIPMRNQTKKTIKRNATRCDNASVSL